MIDNYPPMTNAFLKKILDMIELENKTIISINKENDGFVISDIRNFVSKILPKYFRTKKYSSFVRQLNFYGYRKASSCRNLKNKAEYKHKEFKKYIGKFVKPKDDVFVLSNMLDEMKKENDELKENLDNISSNYEILKGKLNELSTKSIPPALVLPKDSNLDHLEDTLDMDQFSFLDDSLKEPIF